jgi:hypothetical protein
MVLQPAAKVRGTLMKRSSSMHSVQEYHRPSSLEAALALLSRSSSRVRPLAGGTALSHSTGGAEVLVDLCDLGLARIATREGRCHIGAMSSLAELGWVARAVKSNELDDPVNAGFLGPARALAKVSGLPNIVQ